MAENALQTKNQDFQGLRMRYEMYNIQKSIYSIPSYINWISVNLDTGQRKSEITLGEVLDRTEKELS